MRRNYRVEGLMRPGNWRYWGTYSSETRAIESLEKYPWGWPRRFRIIHRLTGTVIRTWP